MEPKSSRLVIYAVEMGKLMSCIVGTLSMLGFFWFFLNAQSHCA